MPGFVLEDRVRNFLNPGRVPLERIRGFLIGLANVEADDPNDTRNFLRQYENFFFVDDRFRRHQEIVELIHGRQLPARPGGRLSHDENGRSVVEGVLEGELSDEQAGLARKLIIERFQSSVTYAWTDDAAPHRREDVIADALDSYDPRERGWLVQEARFAFWQWLFGPPMYPSPLFPSLEYRKCPPNYRFEQAMLYLMRNLHLAKECANRFCSKDRFFLAARANRVYCSNECHLPAKRASELRSYHKNKNKWKRKET